MEVHSGSVQSQVLPGAPVVRWVLLDSAPSQMAEPRLQEVHPWCTGRPAAVGEVCFR